MPASDVTKYCARLPMQPADRQALQPIPHGSSCSSSHDPKLTLEVSKGKLLCHFAPNFLHFRLANSPVGFSCHCQAFKESRSSFALKIGCKGSCYSFTLKGQARFQEPRAKVKRGFELFFPLGKYLHDLVNKILVLKHGTMKSISICSVSSKMDNVDVGQGYYESILNVRQRYEVELREQTRNENKFKSNKREEKNTIKMTKKKFQKRIFQFR